MEKLKVLISNRQKDIKIPTGIRMLIRRCCHAVLVNEDFQGSAEVSISFITNEEIMALNSQYRKKNSVTDVLSFPLGENMIFDKNESTGAFMLGDVVICARRAFEQAELYGHTIQREIGFLTVHSMLHLLGYDHENGGLEALKMREKEEAVLLKLGISRETSYIEKE
ncbi:MAG: rRNA maturation RNase YbeY [Oscillospiraceae bacterium]